jgi:salicylate hydroxylase
VLEAAQCFSESGAGIQIGPNGSRVLLSWDLGGALAEHAARPDRIAIGDGLSGRELASVPLGSKAEARYGAPYYVIERRFLHRILLQKAASLADIAIETGFHLADLRQHETGVSVTASDGRSVEGMALVGADGVHSTVRQRLFGALPRYSGRNAWRATAPLRSGAEGTETAVRLWMAPDAHLVHYSCGEQGPLNAVAVTSGPAASPGWGTAGDIDDLRGAFAHWGANPRGILDRFGDWMTWPLLELAPLPSWTQGRITLLGDAAHPLMPFLASGAIMAIEDAAALATALADRDGDIEAAFRAYETRRIPRTHRVQQASARMGEIYHMQGAMRQARNLVLAALPEAALVRRNDWLYGYCAVD